jgi:molybdopterin-biosynthesis enzyme MoeA-like protein
VHAAPGTGGSLLLFIMAQSHNSIAFPNLRVPPPSVKELADVPAECDVVRQSSVGTAPHVCVHKMTRLFSSFPTVPRAPRC